MWLPLSTAGIDLADLIGSDWLTIAQAPTLPLCTILSTSAAGRTLCSGSSPKP